MLHILSKGRLLDNCEKTVVNVNNYSERHNLQAEIYFLQFVTAKFSAVCEPY
jgi:hypothetical protein